jgi:hypothetical protein
LALCCQKINDENKAYLSQPPQKISYFEWPIKATKTKRFSVVFLFPAAKKTSQK